MNKKTKLVEIRELSQNIGVSLILFVASMAALTLGYMNMAFDPSGLVVLGYIFGFVALVACYRSWTIVQGFQNDEELQKIINQYLRDRQ